MSTRRWSIAIALAAFVAIAAAAASTGKVFGAKPEAAFKSETEKASYAIGVNLARQLKTMASDVDDHALAQGFNDARSIEGKTRLTNQEIAAVLGSLRKTYQQQVKAAHESAGKPATSGPGISVFFKLDPRLTASYGGDRWVSPPTYTRVGDANGAVIDARAQARRADPKTKADTPQWTASDPAMVQVMPDKTGGVTITVKRPGTSHIRITAGELTKELAVKAESRDNALQVEISQQ
jgi:hypothetical protein